MSSSYYSVGSEEHLFVSLSCRISVDYSFLPRPQYRNQFKMYIPRGRRFPLSMNPTSLGYVRSIMVLGSSTIMKSSASSSISYNVAKWNEIRGIFFVYSGIRQELLFDNAFGMLCRAWANSSWCAATSSDEFRKFRFKSDTTKVSDCAYRPS